MIELVGYFLLYLFFYTYVLLIIQLLFKSYAFKIKSKITVFSINRLF